ncbi:hypothetical protein EVG20_g1321 [Dentipellis fragilis]|uniref:Uncharacterized protein n=1 Tax=Dentipellis fragilis TaxID=205917 RepID=A0A4Y9ZA03_9AGAM|nr:hypothetical protein EVG20_g1321 [Dentipellis fragilis]
MARREGAEPLAGVWSEGFDWHALAALASQVANAVAAQGQKSMPPSAPAASAAPTPVPATSHASPATLAVQSPTTSLNIPTVSPAPLAMPTVESAPENPQEKVKIDLSQKKPKQTADDASATHSLPPAACPTSALSAISTPEVATAPFLAPFNTTATACLVTNADAGLHISQGFSVLPETHCSTRSPAPALNGDCPPQTLNEPGDTLTAQQPSTSATLNPRKRSALMSITLEQDLRPTRRRCEEPSAAVLEPSNGVERLTIEISGPSRPATARLPSVTASDLTTCNNRLFPAKPRSSGCDNESPTVSPEDGGDSSSRTIDDGEDLEEGELYDELAGPVVGPDLRVIGTEVGRTGWFSSMIHCDIRPADFSLMSKFLNAGRTTGNVTKTMCISLVCYFAKDLENARDKGQTNPREQVLLACRPAPWPNRGPLYALVNDKTYVPLSAPMKHFDNIIPISAFLQAGQNKVQIRQQANLSDYRFFVVAHHPTHGQLKEIAELRKVEMEWARFVHCVCRPPEKADRVWKQF